MSRSPDFHPPITPVEHEILSFDFGRVLATGISIETAEVLCMVSRGDDEDAAQRIIGSPVLVPSPNTGVDSCAVQQMVGDMVSGVVYVIQCNITTTDNQILNLWSRLACEAPN